MAEDIKLLPIKDIEPSPTNPRKNFPKKEQDDLLQSIRENGLAQPLLVRRVKGGYELVSGERRLRALVEMKAKTVPCYIRDLDDKQAMALQQIENLQRKDLEPLEEAVGFQQLAVDQKMPTVEIAAKVAKTPAYVLRRMRLTVLSPLARKWMTEGKLLISCAEELTRVSSHASQDEILKAADDWDEDCELKDAKQMRQIIENRYLLELGKAPFDTTDASLCGKAGACGACPKRTGNQGALFAGIEGKDLCLDPKCWGEKIEANSKKLVEKFLAAGKTVLRGPSATKAVQELPTMDREDDDFLQDGITWRKALQNVKDFEPTLAIDGKGKVHELVDTKKWAPAIDKKFAAYGSRHSSESSGRAEGGGMTPKQKAERRAVIRANKAKQVMRDVVTLAITQAAPAKLEGKLLSAVAAALLRAAGYSEDRTVGSRLDPSLKSSLKTCAAKMVKEQGAKGEVALVLQLLASYAVSDQSSIRFDFSNGLKILAPALGIDLAKLQAGALKVVDDLAAAKLKAREAKKAKKGK